MTSIRCQALKPEFSHAKWCREQSLLQTSQLLLFAGSEYSVNAKISEGTLHPTGFLGSLLFTSIHLCVNTWRVLWFTPIHCLSLDISKLVKKCTSSLSRDESGVSTAMITFKKRAEHSVKFAKPFSSQYTAFFKMWKCLHQPQTGEWITLERNPEADLPASLTIKELQKVWKPLIAKEWTWLSDSLKQSQMNSAALILGASLKSLLLTLVGETWYRGKEEAQVDQQSVSVLLKNYHWLYYPCSQSISKISNVRCGTIGGSFAWIFHREPVHSGKHKVITCSVLWGYSKDSSKKLIIEHICSDVLQWKERWTNRWHQHHQ